MYKLIPVMDDKREDILSYFEVCFEFIDQGRESGGVLVHCQKGQSRSATVVVAYIMKTQKESLEKALQFVKERRKCIDPNPGFLTQLEAFEFSLFTNVTMPAASN